MKHIDFPCLSVVLSGTPNQVTTLIPSAENGLFSRFIFYYLDLESEWLDVFKNSASDTINLHYEELGKRFLLFHTFSDLCDEIKITLSDAQSVSFQNFFSKQQSLYLNIKSDNYIATIRRLGLIAFRFMMIFTALRFMDESTVLEDRECSDIDFEKLLSPSEWGKDMTDDQREKAQEVIIPVIIVSNVVSSVMSIRRL